LNRAHGIADQLERWRRRQLRLWPHRGAGADHSCRPPQRGCELGDVGGRVGFPAAVTAVAVTASRTCSSATTAGHQAVIRPLTRCGSARARWTAEDRAQIRRRPPDVVRIAHAVLTFVHRLLEVHPSCLRGSSPDARVGIRRLEDPRDDPLVSQWLVRLKGRGGQAGSRPHTRPRRASTSSSWRLTSARIAQPSAAPMVALDPNWLRVDAVTKPGAGWVRDGSRDRCPARAKVAAKPELPRWIYAGCEEAGVVCA
jgi:hypothetical protein